MPSQLILITVVVAVFSTNDTTIVESETAVSVCIEAAGEFGGRSVRPVISYQSSAGEVLQTKKLSDVRLMYDSCRGFHDHHCNSPCCELKWRVLC